MNTTTALAALRTRAEQRDKAGILLGATTEKTLLESAASLLFTGQLEGSVTLLVLVNWEIEASPKSAVFPWAQFSWL